MSVTAAHSTADELRPTDSTLQASGCFLRLKEQAQVPARDAGVLATFGADIGDSVQAGETLAVLQDAEEQLTLRLAEIDLQIATKTAQESVAVEIADAAILESGKLVQQAKIDLDVARKMAQSDVPLRLGQAAQALATEELNRALASKQQFDGSISDLELARKRYEVDKSGLDVEQARDDRDLQKLRSDSRQAFLEQNEIAGKRLNLELLDARNQRNISMLSADRAQAGVNLGQEKLNRRRITAPLTGIVVERMKQQGEWVEAGETVLRIVRLDTLYVEGYVAANLIDLADQGRSVTVRGATTSGDVTVDGHVVFVSPEVDSVNGQVMIKAQISNPELRLRPGQRVEMMIEAAGRAKRQN